MIMIVMVMATPTTTMITVMVVNIMMITLIFCQTNQGGKGDKCPVPQVKARSNVVQKASKRNQ